MAIGRVFEYGHENEMLSIYEISQPGAKPAPTRHGEMRLSSWGARQECEMKSGHQAARR